MSTGSKVVLLTRRLTKQNTMILATGSTRPEVVRPALVFG